MGLQNNADEMEVMDADSQKLAAMLNALPRVEAPSNFEFRVKGGIAQGAPSRYALFPFLKTVAPFALILLVVGFGLLYYERPTGTEVGPINGMSMSGPIVLPAQSESAPATALPESSTVANPTHEMASAPQERTANQTRRPSPTQRTVSSSSSNRAQGGSVDRIIHPANVIMPPGFESANPQNRNANTAVGSATETPVREVLGMLGIEGDFGNGGWRVRSVKENSVGSGAKILAGDVIESIDGQSVRNDARLKGSAKTFTVRRDGKLITLSSGN